MSTNANHNEYLAAVERGRDRMMNGTSFPQWRTLARRRLQVIVTFLGLGLFCIAGPLGAPVVTLAGLLMFAGSALLLRITTRSVADYPDGALDERQIAVRNASYLAAYRIAGACVALLTVGSEAVRLWGSNIVSSEWLVQILSALLFAMLVLPSCVVAWTEKEI